MAIRIGSWGTPEFGITEFIGGLLNKPKTPQGGSNVFGAVPQPSKKVLGTQSRQPVIPSGPPSATQRMASNLGGGGGAPAPAQPPENNLYDDLQGSAESARNSTLDAIQRRLDETRTQARQQISNAEGTRNYIVDFINQRYPELINRVNQQRSDFEQDLSGQETDLTNLYERANAQARRRSESAALQNRMAARAGNRLGSSFYDESVQSNQENLGRTLGESDLERIGKMAAIGTQRTRGNQDFKNTINDLETQKNQATFQAVDEYKRNVQQAEALERAGVLDFGEGQAQAEANLQSRLDSIAQWAQGMAAQRQALELQYGQGGGFDSTLSRIGNANDEFVAGNADTPSGNAALTYAPTLSTPQAQTNNPVNLFANQGLGVRDTDDILRQLGLA
jgi:hypothetical protein